jgi:hypothetical protein
LSIVVEVVTIGGGLLPWWCIRCSSSLHVHVSSSERCKKVAI